jgi:hypothetical protein
VSLRLQVVQSHFAVGVCPTGSVACASRAFLSMRTKGESEPRGRRVRRERLQCALINASLDQREPRSTASESATCIVSYDYSLGMRPSGK